VGRSPRSSAASAIVPVPADCDARIHFGLQRVRLHARALDRELETLARGNYRSAGQWASRAAVPIVRAQCITRYLAVTADRPAVSAEEHGWRRHVDQAREDFRSALSATARSLTRLGDPAIGIAERREVLAELPEYRRRHRRSLGTLDKLLDQVSGAQSERLHLVAEPVGAPCDCSRSGLSAVLSTEPPDLGVPPLGPSSGAGRPGHTWVRSLARYARVS
jgi:hypothetical protein